jgi:hypothetical protein
MKQTARTLVFGSLAAILSVPAQADHNSPNGAGWANMPNDIHNTRIEDGLSGTEFRDFVRRGAGADSVNRYPDRTTTNPRPSIGGGAASRGGSRR